MESPQGQSSRSISAGMLPLQLTRRVSKSFSIASFNGASSSNLVLGVTGARFFAASIRHADTLPDRRRPWRHQAIRLTGPGRAPVDSWRGQCFPHSQLPCASGTHRIVLVERIASHVQHGARGTGSLRRNELLAQPTAPRFWRSASPTPLPEWPRLSPPPTPVTPGRR
jgi:hypothetical protein